MRKKPIISPGRPTDYKDEYCEEAVAFMREGKSIIQLAAHLGVSRDTIYAWAETYTEFKEAIGAGRTQEKAWWADKYNDAALGKIEGVIPSMMIFKMKQFDWTDRQHRVVEEKQMPATDEEVNDIIQKAEK